MQWQLSDEEEGQCAVMLQWGLYGVGTVAIITGTTLYWAGRCIADGSRPRTGLAPRVGPSLAGIAAQGVF